MLRLLSLDDIPFIQRVQKEVGLDVWSEDLLKNIFTENVKGYVFQDQGYIFFKTVLDEIDILSIAVLPSFQRQGGAYAMMQKALQEKANHFFLEVAVSNHSAIKLYEKCGFIQMGVRKNYYSGGSALTMVFRRPLEKDKDSAYL